MNRIAALSAISTSLILAFAPLSPAHATPKPPSVAAKVAGASDRKFEQLALEYYMANARHEPLYATFAGDNRFDDQLGLSIAPQNHKKQIARYKAFASRLHAINPAQLRGVNRTGYEILDYELKTALTSMAFPNILLPVEQMGSSAPTILANFASGQSSQPLTTPKQYRAYLNRLAQLTPWIEQAIVNMREGIRTGVVLPKPLIVATLSQYKKLVSATPEASVFYTPINNLPAQFAAGDKQALTAEYRSQIANRLNPALARLAAFLEQEYLPAGRSTDGIAGMPNGKSWYLAKVAESTTTNLTPDEIHDIGLKEVARIQAQFAIVGPQLGYSGPAAGLPKWVSEQQKFRPFKAEEEILEVYRKLDARLDTKLGALFTLVPKAPLEQRLEPELTRASAANHYTPPSGDGSRPGVFWSVVNDPRAYNSTGMTSLFLHEGKPGHHFQIALQLETPLPEFRRFGGHNAYVEGWALYAETLGKEMGLFNEPDQYFGHLNSELLRAARLVVDTGLHAKGWSREQAIQYLRDTNGYTEPVAKSAIERYMAWPGQALGYKIGALKIAELRARAAAALGSKFSLPAFHAIVLGEGTMPLAVLEKKVDRWIAASR